VRRRTNGYLGASESRFTKNHKSATYELLTINGTYDKLLTMPTKCIDIKLADNKPMYPHPALNDRSTNGHSCVYSVYTFLQCLKQTRITRLLIDSNPSSHEGRGQRSTPRITSFRSINIPVAISHYSFYLKVDSK